jgi:hypothetical protein
MDFIKRVATAQNSNILRFQIGKAIMQGAHASSTLLHAFLVVFCLLAGEPVIFSSSSTVMLFYG